MNACMYNCIRICINSAKLIKAQCFACHLVDHPSLRESDVNLCHDHADIADPSGEGFVRLIIDPVSEAYVGHAVVKMHSSDQAEWVMKDLNEMLFVVSTGPRPLQASLAITGQFVWKLLLPFSTCMHFMMQHTSNPACSPVFT